MKLTVPVRFTQIIAVRRYLDRDFLYALDDRGRVWMREGTDWLMIQNPEEERGFTV
jgi:hypothetical protein